MDSSITSEGADHSILEGEQQSIIVPEGMGSNHTKSSKSHTPAPVSSTCSNITVHSDYNTTAHTNSIGTNGSSTVHSATNTTPATPVPKETVNEKATPTEAMVIQTAPVYDDSGTAASEGAPESTITNSGSRLVTNQDVTTNSTQNRHAIIMSEGDETAPIVPDRSENEENLTTENKTTPSTDVQDDAATQLIIHHGKPEQASHPGWSSTHQHNTMFQARMQDKHLMHHSQIHFLNHWHSQYSIAIRVGTYIFLHFALRGSVR